MSPSRGHREGPHRRNVCPHRARAAVQGAEVVVTATPRMKTRGGRTAGGLLSPELAGGEGFRETAGRGHLRRAWKQDASQARGWGAGDKGNGGSHQLGRSLADNVAFAMVMRPGRAEAPVSHPCHPSPRRLPPDGPALGRPVPLSREGRERTGEHTSHDFCLEVTHIALAHCPSAFVFGQVGTHNPPAE